MPDLHSDILRIARELSQAFDSFSPRLAHFLGEKDFARKLIHWCGAAKALAGKEKVRQLLQLDIAAIDRLLNEQVNAIIHTQRIQRLEATWRSLRSMVLQKPLDSNVRIRVLNATWPELEQDAESSLEFDQTHIFRCIFEDEYGTPGGEPFGLIIGDYAISHRPTNEMRVPLQTLESLTAAAAAAFAPLIVSADPTLFGLESFAEVGRGIDLKRLFLETEYTAWRSFTKREDTRFLCVLLPRILVRNRYQSCMSRPDGFPFQERRTIEAGGGYLWGNPVFAFAAVVIRSFADSGWFEDIVGVAEDTVGGGLVTNAPISQFDEQDDAKFPLEVRVPEHLESQLAAEGFITLCHCKYTNYVAFYRDPTLLRPEEYTSPQSTQSSWLSTQLGLVLCASRFAHHVKVIARDKVGGWDSPAMLQRAIWSWLRRHATGDANPSPSVRSQFVWRSAEIQIEPHPGKPDCFQCVIFLQPHRRQYNSDVSIRFISPVSLRPYTLKPKSIANQA